MIIDNNFEVVEKKTSNKPERVNFKYDLSDNGTDIREIVLNETEQQDNALYFQLEQCKLIKKYKDYLRQKATDNNVNYNPKDSLREYLVYVDFESIFKNKNLNMPLGNEYKEQTKETLEGADGKPYLLRWMFDPENGIQLSFDGKDKYDKNKKWRTFVPFDKSSSMSRSCQITFIDKELKEEVEKRLLLDMRFYKKNPKDPSEDNPIPVVSSKYYAYRGLYLSTGYRIEHEHEGTFDDKLYLNHETVIVISDKKGLLPEKSIFTANTKDSVENKVYDENSLWQFENVITKTKVDFFDGEGLLCREYAEIISDQLQHKYHFEKKSHSFQIRMPFAKGMLHEADFHKYLDDQLEKSIFKAVISEKDPLWIKDTFGISRDLRKAKVILTESMFKCAGWLKKWREFALEGKTAFFTSKEDLHLVKNDPMEYYFSKMQKYHHTLYVTNTDARFSDDTRIPLNYQFFSTLAISPADFESLIQNHFTDIKNLPDVILKKNTIENPINTDETASIDAEENPLQNIKPLNAGQKCLYALKLNKAFANEPKFKNILKSERRKLEKNLCLGRFRVEGEQRFLSGDLLELLRIIYKRFARQLIKKSFKISKLYKPFKKGKNGQITIQKLPKCLYQLYKQFATLRKERLYENRFYMPEKKTAIKSQKSSELPPVKETGMVLYPRYYYAFFRNPHLARNEQCLLRPYIASKSLYKEYFSHLTGIVMVSCESLVPMALSGADFDGDMVKIVCDKPIIKAIQKSTYKEVQKNDRDKNEQHVQYERKLPVIIIPKLNASVGNDDGAIPFETIKNTFANQIGQISNTAIKFARKEYEYIEKNDGTLQENNLPAKDVEDGKCCAACTIVTGLEIDAAKTGVHPKANINLLNTSVNFHDLFLKAKESLKIIYKKDSFITPYVTLTKNGTLTGHLRKKDKKGIAGLSGLYPYSKKDFIAEEPATRPNEGAPIANIDWLPGRYLKYFKDAADERNTHSERSRESNAVYFTFQLKEDWKKFDEEKKSKVTQLVGAYLKIRQLAWKVRRMNEFIKNQQYIRLVKTMLKIQYDNIGQTLLTETNEENETHNISIQDALDRTYAAIHDAVEKEALTKYKDLKKQENQDNKEDVRLDDNCREVINDILKRFVKINWQYTESEEERKNFIFDLLKITPENEKEFPVSVIKLLSNFNNEGYMIFYYILKDIQNYYNIDLDSEAYTKRNDESQSREDEYDDESEAVENATNITKQADSYYEKLYKTFSYYNTRKNDNWNSEIVKICRDELNEIFGKENAESNNMNLALQYVFSIPLTQLRGNNAEKRIIDAQRNFLWNVFTKEEILRNVYVPKDNNNQTSI